MDRYLLSRRRRLVVRAIALAFFALGSVEIAEAPLPLGAPRLIGPAWSPGSGLSGEPELLLPEPARFQLATHPAMRARFLARLEEPGVRLGHLLLSLGYDVPVILILCGMGVALWRSTRLVPDAVESGMPWLIAVGWACAVFAVTSPVLDGLRTGLLLRGIMPGAGFFWYDPDTAGTTEFVLLVAAGLLAATWTISAGLRARADLAEIV